MKNKKGRIMKKRIMGAFFIALIMAFSYIPLSHASSEGTAEGKATDADFLVTEQVNIQGDTKGNLSCNPLSVSNLSENCRIDINSISFNPTNNWQIVSSSTDFAKLGKDEKKISLVADNAHDFVSAYENAGSVASNGEKNISISAKKGVTTIAINEAVGNFTVTIDAVEVIPEGGVYTQANGTVLNEGDPFPETIVKGDTYEYGDYKYTYAANEGYNWHAEVKDILKTSYGELLSEIAGKPMDYMDGTFAYCTSLKTAPAIPQSVTDISYTFYGCTSLTTAPEIPDSVKDMYVTFYGCTSLTTAPAIPQSVTDMSSTFQQCISLTGDIIINASPTDYSKCFDRTEELIYLKGTAGNLEIRREMAKTARNGNVKVYEDAVIPEGGKYITSSDVTLNAGDYFPTEVTTGDEYFEGDYKYLYNGHYRYHAMDGNLKLTNESQNGWGVSVQDKTKTSYPEIKISQEIMLDSLL